MLQGVAADHAAEQIEHLAIKMLQQLREPIPRDHPEDIAAGGIAVLGEQPAHHGQRDHRIELHETVEPQIAASRRLGPDPVDEAEETKTDQHRQ
jgi:hypothetical protein